MIPFCKDCRYFKSGDGTPNYRFQHATCVKLSSVETDPVSGAERVKKSFCANARDEYGKCGPEARLFEAAETVTA